MSVIIKGFDKPKSCFDCPFNRSDCWCAITKGGIDRDDYICDLPCPIEPLDDNVTNGDVIKALFPNATYEHINKMSGLNFTRVKGLNAFEFPQDFYDEWWDAPYKRGEKL